MRCLLSLRIGRCIVGVYWDGGPGIGVAWPRRDGSLAAVRVGWGVDGDLPLSVRPARCVKPTRRGGTDDCRAWLGFYVGWTREGCPHELRKVTRRS